MRELLSERIESESNRRDGLKQISASVHSILLNRKSATYQEICSGIRTSNANTLRRRVYDVLSVMRSLNMVVKTKRCYCLVQRNVLSEKRMMVEEKKRQLEDIQHSKDVFEHIIMKNIFRGQGSFLKRVYFPFTIVVLEMNSDVHCETNEERTYFRFRSNSPIKLTDDNEILKEIYKCCDESEIKKICVYRSNIRRFKENFGGAFDHII